MTDHKDKIKKLSKHELLQHCNNAHSMADVLRNIGVDVRSYYYRILRQKMDEYEIPHIIYNNETRPTTHTLDEVLVPNISFKYSNQLLKTRLIKKGLLHDKCSICGLGPQWHGTPLVLQLDHINGINNDNRIENIRVLCPNCHSQTPTFGGRQLKLTKKTYFCSVCNKEITSSSRSGKCLSCVTRDIKPRSFEVSRDELQKLLHDDRLSYCAIGRKFGVSDNAIRKRCKSLNIDLRTHKKSP